MDQHGVAGPYPRDGVDQVVGDVLRGYGLTMTQYTVLLVLPCEDGMSGGQLARACGVTQQSMARC